MGKLYRNRFIEYMPVHIYCFLILQLYACLPISAYENLNFNRISVDQGLPHSVVLSIYQDSEGFMWFGTGAGFCRYDGYEFRVFKPGINEKTGLNAYTVFDIVEDTFDTKRILWIATSQGINKLNIDKEQIENIFGTDPVEQKLSSAKIVDILKSHDGKVWFASEFDGVFCFNNITEKFIHIQNIAISNSSSPYNSAHCLVELNNNLLCLGMSNSIILIDPLSMNQKLIKFNHQKFPEINQGIIWDIHQDRNGTIWIGTENGINILEIDDLVIKKHTPQKIGYPTISVRDITELQNGDLLISTSNTGLILLDDKGNFKRKYLHTNTQSSSLSTNNLNCSYIDCFGGLWIGTFKGGINYSNLAGTRFHNINNQTPEYADITDNNVYGITDDKKYVWVGTWNGNLICLNKKDLSIEQSITSHIEKSGILRENSISSLLTDNQQNLWIGCFNKGLIRLNIKDPKNSNNLIGSLKYNTHYLPASGKQNSLNGWSVRAMEMDKKGNIWIGTWNGGLNRYMNSKDSFKDYGYLKTENDSVKINGIRQIYSAPQGWNDVLWITNKDHGLIALNTSRDELIQFEGKYAINFNTSHNNIWSILQDGDGIFWLATSMTGLVRLEFRTTEGKTAYDVDQIKSINTTFYYLSESGLNTNILGILDDRNSTLWVSTEIGLFSFNKTTGNFTPYSKTDGVLNNEFNFGAFHATNEGVMFFGGSNGLTFLYPERHQPDTIKSIPVLTNLRVNNKIIRPGDKFKNHIILPSTINQLQKIALYHQQNDFSFEFSALQYHNPARYAYKYKMEGFDNNWKFTDAEHRIASYTNLPAGEYTFILTASNSAGIWNQIPKTIEIKIIPPWWKSQFAYTFYIASMISLILLTFHISRLRNKKISEIKLKRAIAEKNHEVDQLKLNFFMNVSHEFRTPLTLINGPVDELIRNEATPEFIKEELKIVNKNSNRLLRLVDQLLEIRKLDMNSVSLKQTNGDIIHFISEIFASFAFMAKNRNIKYLFHSETESLTCMFDPDIVEKIIVNLLSNAFKYSEKEGEIKVEILHSENEINITISDTGIGIPLNRLDKIFNLFYRVEELKGNKTGQGIGLALAKELAKLHQGDILVESEKGKGSRFRVILPLLKDTENQSADLTKTILTEQKDYRYLFDECSLNNTPPQISLSNMDQLIEQQNKPIALIIDDHSDIRHFISRNLNVQYFIIEASNGKEALNAAFTYIPDIIICDIMMPEIDGIEFTKTIKSDYRTNHIPIILLTARSSEEHEKEGLMTGADDYISKPFNMEHLQFKLRNIITSRKKLQERFQSELITPLIKQNEQNNKDEFLFKITEYIKENIQSSEFSVHNLIRYMAMSRAQFYRKTKALTGLGVNEYILKVQLLMSCKLLKRSNLSISSIAYETGFSNPSNFSRKFRETFHCSPKEYRESERFEHEPGSDSL